MHRAPRRVVPGVLRGALRRAAAASVLFVCAAAPLAAQRPARGARPGATPATPGKPTLVVYFTIDQFSSDYLIRFGGGFTRGLARLRDEGATWARGVHDHAITETAPGHAATLSGRFPVHTGISSNSQGVNTPDAPLIGARDLGASPFRFQGTTLYDWMKAADPATRALSVSRKDRGAILPIGKAKTDVYWYASNGMFTTSTYYRDTLPTWVTRFNARRAPHAYAGKSWTLLLPEDRYGEPDSITFEGEGREFAFPHPFPTDSARAASAIRETPWMDSLTLAFALEGVKTLELGAAADRTDLLAISLSSTDAVGHKFGPDSREIHDHLLRLDRFMGDFLDALFALRDKRRIIIALSADHGVAPYADLRSPWYPNAGAQRVDQAGIWPLMYAAMRAKGIDTTALFYDDGVRVRDAEAFSRAGVDPDDIAAIWVREMRRRTGVLRADLVRDLARADTTSDHVARRWLHMFDATGPVRAVSTNTPYSYWTGVTYATHGSPHDYDAFVPIIFWGEGIAPGARGTQARVVDIAPTLATILKVAPLEKLDGQALTLTP